MYRSSVSCLRVQNRRSAAEPCVLLGAHNRARPVRRVRAAWGKKTKSERASPFMVVAAAATGRPLRKRRQPASTLNTQSHFSADSTDPIVSVKKVDSLCVRAQFVACMPRKMSECRCAANCLDEIGSAPEENGRCITISTAHAKYQTKIW